MVRAIFPALTRVFALTFIAITALTLSRAVLAEAPINLVIIQTDEHNFRTLGCYRETLPQDQALIWGEEAVVETPAIDSIAKRGAICTSYYATSPVCTPSRASFVTGMYPHHTGAPANNEPMRHGIVTFAQVLRDQGYATGYAGKWHLDGPGKPQWQPERSFGFTDNRYMFNRGHWKQFELTPEGPQVAARKNGQPTYSINGANEDNFATDWLTSRAIEFIQENADQPFCYYLSLPDPHGPNSVRAPYDTMYTDRIIRPPWTYSRTTDNPKWAPPAGTGGGSRFRSDLMSQYFGMVRCIDDNVARLLRTLDELGLTERTAIVFTADHGDLCYEHGRLNKGNPYEGSAKIPMLIAVPGQIPAGTVVNQALGTVDFTPTILKLLGFDRPSEAQGRDASNLLTGKAGPWTDIAFLRNAGLKASWVAAVTDRFKLVVSLQDEPWLFDLQEDPHELQNAFEKPELAETRKQMANQLLSYGEQFADPFVAVPGIHDQLIAIRDARE